MLLAQGQFMQKQPRLQGLLLLQNGGRRNPWPRLPKWLRKFVRILSRKHFEMSTSFRLNDGFRLQKYKQGHQTLKPTSEKAISSYVTWQNRPRFLEYFSSVVPKSYRPEGQPSSPRTKNPSRASVGIVSSIPIWWSISLTKCLNWLSGYGSVKMKSTFSFSLHDWNVLGEVWLPNIKALSWLWNLFPVSFLLNSKIYAHLAKYFSFHDADNNLNVKRIFFFLQEEWSIYCGDSND